MYANISEKIDSYEEYSKNLITFLIKDLDRLIVLETNDDSINCIITSIQSISLYKQKRLFFHVKLFKHEKTSRIKISENLY